MAFDFIETAIAKRRQDGLYRQTCISENKQGRYIKIAGQQYLNFSSNDYLGLASSAELIQAWQKGAEYFGVGSGGSFLVTGYNQTHADLCEQLKSWLGVESVALFNSGYSANQAIIKLLLDKKALLLQDKLNHASLMEAGSLAPCKMLRFKHNDMSQLNNILTKQANPNTLIISEGVFSMDGDKAPTKQLIQHAKAHNSWLMIDDAHGIGVLGNQGRGSVVATGKKNSALQIYMATFGKALGVSGAFVAGSQSFIDYLNNFSKPYIYTTGMPPAMAYTISYAVQLVQEQVWRRDKLNALIREFKTQANNYAIQLSESDTAIQPLIIGDSQKASQVATKLREKGFWVTAIRPPTVPNNTARLRITLTSNHEKQDIIQLLKTISTILSEC